MDLLEKYNSVRTKVPDTVVLVAVSKTKPASMILDLYKAGHVDFGENKVQDLVAKYEELPKGIRWHMIGHLQTNKVKYIAPFVHLIHAVDSMKLLKVIEKEALKNERIISCLLQVHIAEEESKFGMSETELKTLFNSPEFHEMKNIRISGLMGMATFTDDSDVIRAEFKNLKRIFDSTKENYFSDIESFSTLSMGMSDDYQIAIEEGSNMVRVGSSIFGARNYH